MRDIVEKLSKDWIDDEFNEVSDEAKAEIESLRQQLAEKDAESERLYKSLDENWCSHPQLVASQEALHAQQIGHEHIVAEKDAQIERLRNALEKMTDVFLDTEGNHGPYEQEAFEMAYKVLEDLKCN